MVHILIGPMLQVGSTGSAYNKDGILSPSLPKMHSYIDLSSPQAIVIIFDLDLLVDWYAKQKHLGCKKSARPIRSSMQAGRCDQKL